MQFHDAAATRGLLDYPRLVEALEGVLAEYGRGEVHSPERFVMPYGKDGWLLSMPCRARDLVVHKLVTVQAANPSRGLPAIQGQVTAFDAADGRPLLGLDGPTVTARRTAAVSMVGIARLRPAPASITVIGTGIQAHAHLEAALDLHPGAELRVRGRSEAAERALCDGFGGRVAPQPPGPIGSDVVIAATSSPTPVYDQPAEPGRLVIGVGAYRLDMAEIGPITITGSELYVDDPAGAPGEAGDLAAAGVDWSRVRPLWSALDGPVGAGRPVFLKSVGCAAWDLAACRAALAA